jgi:hypothetical protein|eukprot:COSAG01_NODE_785_length_13619_cov_42.075222_8_plen_159_part_00
MRKTSEDFESVRTHLPLSSSSICLLLALALNTRGRSRPCTDRPPRCSPSRPVAAARAIYCGCCLCGFVDTGAAMHVSHTDPACDVHLSGRHKPHKAEDGVPTKHIGFFESQDGAAMAADAATREHNSHGSGHHGTTLTDMGSALRPPNRPSRAHLGVL